MPPAIMRNYPKAVLAEEEHLLATLERDSAKTQKAGLLEIYRRLRPGEPPTVESAEALLKRVNLSAAT